MRKLCHVTFAAVHCHNNDRVFLNCATATSEHLKPTLFLFLTGYQSESNAIYLGADFTSVSAAQVTEASRPRVLHWQQLPTWKFFRSVSLRTLESTFLFVTSESNAIYLGADFTSVSVPYRLPKWVDSFSTDSSCPHCHLVGVVCLWRYYTSQKKHFKNMQKYVGMTMPKSIQTRCI